MKSFQVLFFDVDFNPLPRKEGDLDVDQTNCSAWISIHSLVKRETAFVLMPA